MGAVYSFIRRRRQLITDFAKGSTDTGRDHEHLSGQAAGSSRLPLLLLLLQLLHDD